MSPRIWVQVGPATFWVRSATRSPASGASIRTLIIARQVADKGPSAPLTKIPCARGGRVLSSGAAAAQPARHPTLRESQPCGLRTLAKGPLPPAAPRPPPTPPVRLPKSPYVEPAAEGTNEATGPFSPACGVRRARTPRGRGCGG